MIWDENLILFFDNDIKELNKIIVHIEIPKSEIQKIEDMQLIENSKVDKTTSIIIR